MILADTNVLIDLTTADPVWADWSQRQLSSAALFDELAINDIVFAELSVRYARIEQVEAALKDVCAALIPIPRAALFLAGKAFQRYRAAGGVCTGVLPDFFIGAHAVIADAALITRDMRRYLTYFPGIRLIAPG